MRGSPTPETARRRRQTAAIVLLIPFLVLGYLGLRAALFDGADTRGAVVLDLSLESDAVGERQPVDVVVPEGGGEGRPLLVFLHGKGGDQNTDTENGAMFAALDELGGRAPVIAFPDGGDGSYWHDRDSGEWGEYVVDEVIPLAAEETGADPERVAVGGISMGGFGAYDLALENPGRFCAVGGHSPALWLSGGETAPGAFDDADDFEAHDVIGRVRADPQVFGGIPIWNDIGYADPFVIGSASFVEALEGGEPQLTAKIWPGGHDSAYWDAHWDEYLRFYARALARC